MGPEPKKTLLFRIYQIFYDYSDIDHPLTQQRVIELLRSVYGIECERKAVGRNISIINEMGLHGEIVPAENKNGFFLDGKRFEYSELRLLIDSVLCSRHINDNNTEELIDKLVKEGGKNFTTHVKHIYSVKDWAKSENADFMLNVELVDEAIEEGKKISFNYNKVGLDKKLQCRHEVVASPYQTVFHNQHYYLICYDERHPDELTALRIDKMTEMQKLEDSAARPLTSVPGYKRGMNYNEIATSLPYMFMTPPENVKIRCPLWMTDDVVDWFGTDLSFKQSDPEHFTTTVRVSLAAMEFWAMQYNTNVEVLSPEKLRNNIARRVAEMAKLYGVKPEDIKPD